MQARSSRPQIRGIEYAREAAHGIDLISGIDEQHADDATRVKFCNDASSSCLITGRGALTAFIEATAARPDRKGHWRSSSTGTDASA